MGWYDCHLHSFRDGQQNYEPPQPDYFGWPSFGPEPINERHVLIEIMKDPKHPEYDGYKEWLGHNLSPEHFDLEDHNTALSQLAKR